MSAHVKQELLDIHQRSGRRFLKSDQADDMDELAKNLVNEMINTMKIKIEEKQKNNHISSVELSSSELVDFRTVRFEIKSFYYGISKLINEKINECFFVDSFVSAALNGFGENNDIFFVQTYPYCDYVLIKY